MRPTFTAGLLLLSLIHAAPTAPDPAVTAIIGVHVISMTDSNVAAGETVIVRGGRIAWVGPASEARIPPGARRVAGGNGYLIPGLADFHVHVDQQDLPLFVANGVTTARELNGTAQHLVWRARMDVDSVTPMPTLFVSGTLLSGMPVPWRHLLVTTPAEGRAAVREQLQDGYDFIKVYSGLSRETYDTIMARARSARRPVTGHIPAAVGLDGVLASGQGGIEHVEQLMYATTADSADTSVIGPAVAKIRASGVWIEPTIAVMEVLSAPTASLIDSLAARPAMQYVDSGTTSWWLSIRRPPGHQPRDPSIGARQIAWMRRMVRELHAAGVPMLAGTDTPNPFMVPGFSLIDELEALERAGISRFDALTMATRNPARLVGQDTVFGVIRPGARADLVLLRDNPLDNLEALRAPRAVVLRGHFYDEEALRSLLAAARKRIRG